MKLIIKFTTVLILALLELLTACTTQNNQNKPIQTNSSKNNTKIEKDFFIKNYKNGEIKLYNEEKVESLYNKIVETQEFNPYLLTKSDILNILGTPNLIKASYSNELWQYRSSFCIINFVWDNSIKEENNIIKIISYDYKNQNKIDDKNCILFNKNSNYNS